MRPTIAEIDLTALEHNLRVIRSMTATAAEMMAVVKANAYGHGAVEVSKIALANGCSQLAVAIPEEGIALREAGIDVPILILSLTLPQQAHEVVAYNLMPTVSTLAAAQILSEQALQQGKQCHIFVKVDTGMSRIGVKPNQAIAFLKSLQSLKGILVQGIFTHYAMADAADKKYTQQQSAAFQQLLDELAKENIQIPYHTAANSAAILELPETHYNLVRPGIILYGYYPSAEVAKTIPLKQVMHFKTKISYIKQVAKGCPVGYGCTYIAPHDTCIATLPVGYADGYSRLLSNKAHVLIGGKRCPVIGRVCMDQIMVDVGPDSTAQIGDEAVLFGRQGNAFISTEEIASIIGTISYEVVCAVSSRVPRVYVRHSH